MLARRGKYDIYFDFYGKYDNQTGQLIKEKQYKFIFVDHGWVTESEIEIALSTADILVNIGNNSPLIPSKLFLYLSYGKAIIHQCIIERDACLYYLKQYQNVYIFRVDDIITDDTISNLEDFILQFGFQKIDVGGMFERCTPKFTAQLLEKNDE